MIKIISSIIPTFKDYIYTYFGLYKQDYRGEIEELTGNGQGNVFASILYRDQSYREFQQLNEERLEAIFKSPHSQIEAQRAAISFMDDTDFYSNGENYKEGMTKMIEKYNKYHQITGGKISSEKSTYFY